MIENEREMPGHKPILPGFKPVVRDATVPPEAWDRTHPDHDWWVNGRGWCYDPACQAHTFGRPAEETP